MSDLPSPLVPDDVDLRGFSGFMLDVDRLLASELVALGTPEECWAATMLWCRAWKQSPPGSLPNDDRILAAFSGAGPRWSKVKEMALRGFVLCSDGRLHHHVLAEQVMSAWQKRQSYRNDQERLKKWREDKRKKANETPNETGGEMRFTPVSRAVSSGISKPDRQGQGQGQGQGQRERINPPTPQPASATGAGDDLFFSEFWLAYPRKDDKGHARKAWNVAVRKASPPDIIAGVRRYRFNDDPKFRPLAATWLNGERWSDLGLGVAQPEPPVERTEANPTGRPPTPMSGGL